MILVSRNIRYEDIRGGTLRFLYYFLPPKFLRRRLVISQQQLWLLLLLRSSFTIEYALTLIGTELKSHLCQKWFHVFFCRNWWLESIVWCRRPYLALTWMSGIAVITWSIGCLPTSFCNHRGPIGLTRSTPDHWTAAANHHMRPERIFRTILRNFLLSDIDVKTLSNFVIFSLYCYKKNIWLKIDVRNLRPQSLYQEIHGDTSGAYGAWELGQNPRHRFPRSKTVTSCRLPRSKSGTS